MNKLNIKFSALINFRDRFCIGKFCYSISSTHIETNRNLKMFSMFLNSYKLYFIPPKITSFSVFLAFSFAENYLYSINTTFNKIAIRCFAKILHKCFMF